MTDPERLRRPVPERTKPNRGILGALGQSEGPVPPATPREAHPLTPGFTETQPNASLSPGSAQYINDSVRAASDVVDEHIRQGQAAAQSLSGGVLHHLTGQKESGQLLGSLTRAYSDLASVWVEIAKTVAGQIGDLKPAASAQAAQSTDPTQSTPIALIVDCVGRAETRMDMFRRCTNLVAQPLVAQGGSGVSQIKEVSFSVGQDGQAGVLHVRVPDDAAPGRYYGMLLNAADMTPAGALSLYLKGEGETIP